MGWIMEFKKPFVKCTIPLCKRKHYAKGYCQYHYDVNCRSVYSKTQTEYKKTIKAKNKHEYSIGIHSNDFYSKLKESKISSFQYADIMTMTGWKYERVKYHIIKLIKAHKIIAVGKNLGGKNQRGIFKLVK